MRAEAEAANGAGDAEIHEADDMGIVVPQQLSDRARRAVLKDPLRGVGEGASIAGAAGSILHFQQGAQLELVQAGNGELKRLLLREERKQPGFIRGMGKAQGRLLEFFGGWHHRHRFPSCGLSLERGLGDRTTGAGLQVLLFVRGVRGYDGVSVKRLRTIGLALMLGAICLAYSNSFHNGFHFDDFHTVVDNPAIRSLHTIPRFFRDATTFSVLPANRTYRPMVSTTLALDYALGRGYAPVWFHVGTFGLFLGLVVLLDALYLLLLGRIRPSPENAWIALFGAAWFGLHPAMAETVNYVIQRGDLYCTLGCVGALFLFAQYPRLRRTGSILCRWRLHCCRNRRRLSSRFCCCSMCSSSKE
jgi:hypothetical protein